MNEMWMTDFFCYSCDVLYYAYCGGYLVSKLTLCINDKYWLFIVLQHIITYYLIQSTVCVFAQYTDTIYINKLCVTGHI